VRGAATSSTIVEIWSSHNASKITRTGRRAVVSAEAHFYFTSPAPMGPRGWASCEPGVSILEAVPF
jgi:hypothetical protein